MKKIKTLYDTILEEIGKREEIFSELWSIFEEEFENEYKFNPRDLPRVIGDLKRILLGIKKIVGGRNEASILSEWIDLEASLVTIESSILFGLRTLDRIFYRIMGSLPETILNLNQKEMDYVLSRSETLIKIRTTRDLFKEGLASIRSIQRAMNGLRYMLQNIKKEFDF